MVSKRRSPSPLAALILSLAWAGWFAPQAEAQEYFGRNKVQYRSFAFEVLKTEHFDVYFYEDERVAAEEAARMAERWYDRLSRVLQHELSGRQPLILYASHPDFEQTNAIHGDLNEATGGVTEFLKRRIVLPLAGPLAETDHVIGHELVHAFQFDITGQRRSEAGFIEPAAARLPLWFIEGMAEYLSVGADDPHTAMWIRDAARVNRLPTIHKLQDPRYFPYRFGQALWAYIAGRWGDDAVGQILKATVKGTDAEKAIQGVLGLSADTLSSDWHAAIRAWAAPVSAATGSPADLGRVLIGEKSGVGRLNVAPALSPDGSRLMFLSERSLLSIEMFLADAQTGKILRKITRTAVDPHYQSLQFIQSAGAWSPDGRKFAFAAVTEGRPVLSVMDVQSGRTEVEIPFPELGEIFNPSWAPDGERIVFSAIAGGVCDLFRVNIRNREVRRLTQDSFAEIQPAWSPDGNWIAFVTDRYSTDLDSLSFGNERITLLDPESGVFREVAGFKDAKNINPQWTADGKSLFFVSDHGGISNVFRITLATGEISQVTSAATGVSGITRLSPAMSAARSADRMVFSLYENGNYNLYLIDSAERLAGKPPRAQAGDPGMLPPPDRRASEIKERVSRPSVDLARTTFKREPYRARLSLDYVAQPSVGVAAGTGGLSVGGGTTLYWSDILGNHNLATLLQINNAGGSVVNNIAAVVAYENRKSRWNWGTAVGQIPYLTRQFVIDEGTLDGEPAVRERDFRSWQIDRQVVGTAEYPFSRVQRVELSAGYRFVDFVSEVETRIFSSVTGDLLSDTTSSLPSDTLPSLHLATASAALVYDTSVFGGTGPIVGQRFRLEAAPVFGDLQYLGALGDYRRYLMILRPLVIAGRVLHYGRYGRGAEDERLSQLFLGDPWLVRGYDSGSFTIDECGGAGDGPCPTFDRLLGSRIAVTNLELRVPLLGALGVIRSPAIPPIEAAAFFDAGVAWTRADEASFLGGDRDPVTSHGAALRVNVLGFAVAEFAFVHPNDRPGKGWFWQFALQPGF